MKTAFIFHGAYGSPEENWLPWLKKELEVRRWKMIVPPFPTPQNQSLENWERVFAKHAAELGSDTIFVAHSIGCAFALSQLQKSEKRIEACFLVSGFLRGLGNPDFDSLNSSFLEFGFDWDKIREKSAKFVVFHGDNDPYVPIEMGKELAEKLGARFIVIKNGGHLNEKAGFKEFVQLLDEIER